mmetsp:Transcript_14524/g.41852  ORF Transcript_14524/g.41852 Transcript_14524/m.41852 type:complete len:201 (-) Transcript_14524:212-814(-)
MLIPKKHRIATYMKIFEEGVLVAKKDLYAKHTDIDVPNLHVLKLLQSLKSRGYVTERFSWLHFYYFLTNEGIEYLREFLHVPADVVPATLKKSAPRTGRPPGFGGPRGEGGAPREGGGYGRGGDRDSYRGPRRSGPGAEGGEKKGDFPPSGDFKPEFRGFGGRGGGFGRGGGDGYRREEGGGSFGRGGGFGRGRGAAPPQ